MERMTFIAELVDRMSAPSRRMTRSLWGLYTATHQGRNSLGQFTEKAESMRRTVNLGSIDALDLKSSIAWLGAGLLAVGVGFATLSFKIGEAAFSNFAFKESALAVGKVLWGTTEAADAMFKKATAIAKLTPFNVGETVTSFNRLGASGFSAEEVPVVFQGLADIASMSGKGAESISGMTRAFSDMMSKGHLMTQELNQMTEAAPGAINRLALFRNIARIMGTTEDSVGSLIENGLVPARVAIMSVMQVAKSLGGGIVGANSVEQSKTLGGLWSNLQDTITNLWLTMDLTKAPWFKAVKNFMAGLVEALDTSTASGKELQAVFNRLFGKAIDGFIGDGTADMGGKIIDLAHSFEFMANMGIAAFQGLWEGLKAGFAPLIQASGLFIGTDDDAETMRQTFEGLGEMLAHIATGFAIIAEVAIKVAGLFQWLGESVTALWDSLVNIFDGIARFIGGGLVSGLTSGFTEGNAAMTDGANNLVYGFKRLLGISSPSKVFEGFGENVVEGFNRGVEGMGMNATLGSDLAAGATARGVSGGAGSGASVSITVQVDNTGHGDGDSIAQRIAELLPSVVSSMFDQLAVERGV